MRERRTFAPVVLLGLVSAGLAAVASNQAWVRAGIVEGTADTGYAATMALDLEPDVPLASALSLLVLAAWGVILVTRTRTRRVLAVVALLASAALTTVVLVSASTLPTGLRADFAAIGAEAPEIAFTGWYAVALVASLLALVGSALAIWLAAGWPEMGSRYDAPRSGAASGDREPPAASGAPDDLWKAIEQGHDPTEDSAP